MKSTLIPYKSAATLARLSCAILCARDFEVLENGCVSQTIIALSNGFSGGGKEVRVDLIPSVDGWFRVEVSVRNLGLELHRDRKNDRMEIAIVRDFHKIVYEKSQPRRLALIA